MGMDDAKYEYVCESQSERGFPLLHTHRIVVRHRRSGTLVRFSVAMGLLLLWMRMRGEVLVLLGFVLLLSWVRFNRSVDSEAVVVMPTLGVQLETVYRSKRVSRRFVPLHRILWPVINEAVTPTTCFTYLALLLRDDSRLTLTFLHVRPPLPMLVPIWRALGAAVGHPRSACSRTSRSPHSSFVSFQ